MSAPTPLVRVEAAVRRRGGFMLGPLAFELARGEWVALVGPSGAGKTTLLQLLAGLDVVDEGRVEVDGLDLRAAGEAGRAALRRDRVGFVFQERHMIAHLTVAENVAVRLVPAGVSRRERHERAAAELAALGLDGYADRDVTTLSGGELQRVAVARACIGAPRLLLADEPTASVDAETAALVLTRLAALREAGATLFVSSHDSSATAAADSVVELAAGRRVR